MAPCTINYIILQSKSFTSQNPIIVRSQMRKKKAKNTNYRSFSLEIKT